MGPGSHFFENVVRWSLGMRGWSTPYIECCARIFKHGQDISLDDINLSKMRPVFVWRNGSDMRSINQLFGIKNCERPIL